MVNERDNHGRGGWQQLEEIGLLDAFHNQDE